MKHSTLFLTSVSTALSMFSGSVGAQGKAQFDLGQREYQSSCASCHGVNGKGDGAMKNYLTQAPTNLTTVTKANGGVFPYQRLWQMIDGRSASVMPGPHGAREMPVWGDVFRADDQQPQDWFARNRMAALLDYLARIQEK